MTTEISNFLSIANQNSAQFAYQLYHVLNQSENVEIFQSPDNQNTFIYKYKNYLTTYGHKGTVEKLLSQLIGKNIIDKGTRWEITFQNHHRTIINSLFDDFDFIEEFGGGNDAISNNLQTMELQKSNFTPRRQLKAGKKIRADLLDHFDQDLKNIVERGGYVYGVLEDTELKSVCPVPYIYKDSSISFAVLHGIKTNEKYRKKGYATGSVRAALNFLFTRKTIKSIFLWVDEDNFPAVHMFEKIGFESVGNWIGTRCFLKEK